jgi:two-component system, OmpR family, response regulator ArlR
MIHSFRDMPNSVLLVEDDLDLQSYLQNAFLEKGFSVFSASHGMMAIKIFEKVRPDIVILDVQLPDVNGETVCTEIKKRSNETPVVFLTANDTTPHITHGFEVGADDYISKPFVLDELFARVGARLKPADRESGSILKVGNITVNKKTYQVTKNDSIIPLTPKEFILLEYLIVNKNQVVSREQILGSIWKYNWDIESRVVDMYIGMLRKKIDTDPQKKLIHSIRGFGYILKE